MSHDPGITILYSFVWQAVEEGVARVTFDRGEDECGFRVRFDGQEIETPRAPAGLFAGIRYWAIELSGVKHEYDGEQTSQYQFPDCNDGDVGGPFGCYAKVDAKVRVDAQRVEIEVLRVDGQEFTAQRAARPSRPLATHFDVRSYIELGYDETAIFLLNEYCSQKSADINARDNDGRTMLMVAASYGSLSVARMLLQMGADPTLCDSWSETAFDKAAQRGKNDVANLLQAVGTQQTATTDQEERTR